MDSALKKNGSLMIMARFYHIIDDLKRPLKQICFWWSSSECIISACSPSGSRIASWLPSFSVEVMHTTNILGIAQANNSQLNAMVSPSAGVPHVY